MIGVELLTVLGGVLTSGIFIPPFVLKRKREAAIRFLKNEEAKSNARYSSYNLKQGHLDNACEHVCDTAFSGRGSGGRTSGAICLGSTGKCLPFCCAGTTLEQAASGQAAISLALAVD